MLLMVPRILILFPVAGPDIFVEQNQRMFFSSRNDLPGSIFNSVKMHIHIAFSWSENNRNRCNGILLVIFHLLFIQRTALLKDSTFYTINNIVIASSLFRTYRH